MGRAARFSPFAHRYREGHEAEEGTMKVLVVEDEELIRLIVVDALEDAGFEVIEAATGEEALSRCQERVADVLFTDIRLPGTVDGWDVAEHCRDLNPQMPVVYASGHSLVEHRPVSGSRFFQSHTARRPSSP
jgi:CheY-like chemotaxis protein